MLKELYTKIKLDNFKGGTYIAVNPTQETKLKLQQYIDNNLVGIDCYEMDKLHCTIIYSKKPLENSVDISSEKHNGLFKHFNIFGEENECLVCEFESKTLQARNKELVNIHSFISDFPEYKTHITLSVCAQNIDYSILPPLNFDLEFENEYIEPLNLDWKNN